MMTDKCKTIAIKTSLKEMMDTGLISQEAVDALTAERLIAQEKVENLKKLFAENVISKEQMEREIKRLQKEIEDKINLLDIP